MNFLLKYLFIFSAPAMFGQPEIGKKSKFFLAIPALNNSVKIPLPEKKQNNPFSNVTALKNAEPFYTNNNDLFKEKKKPSFVIGEDRNNILEPKPAFINPNLDVLDKLNGVGKQVSEGFKEIRGNQDLGNFNSKSKFVNIRYRDFGEVDDDKIRIYLNGHIVAQSVTLLGFYTGLEISLEKGFNKIDFEALNQGTTGPNTAEFQIFDDNKSLISQNQWNLVTGFKASIMIFKD